MEGGLKLAPNPPRQPKSSKEQSSAPQSAHFKGMSDFRNDSSAVVTPDIMKAYQSTIATIKEALNENSELGHLTSAFYNSNDIFSPPKNPRPRSMGPAGVKDVEDIRQELFQARMEINSMKEEKKVLLGRIASVERSHNDMERRYQDQLVASVSFILIKSFHLLNDYGQVYLRKKQCGGSSKVDPSDPFVDDKIVTKLKLSLRNAEAKIKEKDLELENLKKSVKYRSLQKFEEEINKYYIEVVRLKRLLEHQEIGTRLIDDDPERLLNYDDAISEFCIKLSKEQALTKELTDANSRLTCKTEQYSSQIQTLNGQLYELTNKHEGLQTENENLTRSHSKLAQEFDEIAIRYEKASIDLSDLQEKYNQVAAENQDLKRREEQLKSNIESLARKYEKIEQLQLQVEEDAAAQKGQDSKRIISLEGEFQALKELNSSLEQKIERQTSDFAKIQTEKQDAFDKEHEALVALRAELSGCQKTNFELQNSNLRLSQGAKQTEILQAQNMKSEIDLSLQRGISKSLESQLSECRERASILDRKLATSEFQTAQYYESLKCMQEVNAALNSQLASRVGSQKLFDSYDQQIPFTNDFASSDHSEHTHPENFDSQENLPLDDLWEYKHKQTYASSNNTIALNSFAIEDQESASANERFSLKAASQGSRGETFDDDQLQSALEKNEVDNASSSVARNDIDPIESSTDTNCNENPPNDMNVNNSEERPESIESNTQLADTKDGSSSDGLENTETRSEVAGSQSTVNKPPLPTNDSLPDIQTQINESDSAYSLRGRQMSSTGRRQSEMEFRRPGSSSVSSKRSRNSSNSIHRTPKTRSAAKLAKSKESSMKSIARSSANSNDAGDGLDIVGEKINDNSATSRDSLEKGDVFTKKSAASTDNLQQQLENSTSLDATKTSSDNQIDDHISSKKSDGSERDNSIEFDIFGDDHDNLRSGGLGSSSTCLTAEGAESKLARSWKDLPESQSNGSHGRNSLRNGSSELVVAGASMNLLELPTSTIPKNLRQDDSVQVGTRVAVGEEESKSISEPKNDAESQDEFNAVHRRDSQLASSEKLSNEEAVLNTSPSAHSISSRRSLGSSKNDRFASKTNVQQVTSSNHTSSLNSKSLSSAEVVARSAIISDESKTSDDILNNPNDLPEELTDARAKKSLHSLTGSKSHLTNLAELKKNETMSKSESNDFEESSSGLSEQTGSSDASSSSLGSGSSSSESSSSASASQENFHSNNSSKSLQQHRTDADALPGTQIIREAETNDKPIADQSAKTSQPEPSVAEKAPPVAAILNTHGSEVTQNIKPQKLNSDGESDSISESGTSSEDESRTASLNDGESESGTGSDSGNDQSHQDGVNESSNSIWDDQLDLEVGSTDSEEDGDW
ncbi:hypothetical protein HDU83_002003 [Entophlyctis luteolus]|nr:hypothetical protein HDU83_002003 [Entophlyctis luteolus]